MRNQIFSSRRSAVYHLCDLVHPLLEKPTSHHSSLSQHGSVKCPLAHPHLPTVVPPHREDTWCLVSCTCTCFWLFIVSLCHFVEPPAQITLLREQNTGAPRCLDSSVPEPGPSLRVSRWDEDVKTLWKYELTSLLRHCHPLLKSVLTVWCPSDK